MSGDSTRMPGFGERSGDIIRRLEAENERMRQEAESVFERVRTTHVALEKARRRFARCRRRDSLKAARAELEAAKVAHAEAVTVRDSLFQRRVGQ